jgi:hypothetical protein
LCEGLSEGAHLLILIILSIWERQAFVRAKMESLEVLSIGVCTGGRRDTKD